jgi:hypothetical protein
MVDSQCSDKSCRLISWFLECSKNVFKSFDSIFQRRSIRHPIECLTQNWVFLDHVREELELCAYPLLFNFQFVLQIEAVIHTYIHKDFYYPN